MELKTSIHNDSTKKIYSMDSKSSKLVNIKKIDLTINKWLNLQKILKENQSLEKIIETQHLENFNKLKEYIHTFYELKIKSRKIYKEIEILKMRADWINISNKKETYLASLEESRGIYFGMADKKIMNIISFIRENYDYVPKIISLIDKNDSIEEIESLAEFFCNQFYTNILIPNPEQEELLICIYKLLEQEINKMDSLNLDSFLDDSTFIGKLMNAFSKQPEINNFIVNLINKVINEVERRNNLFMDLSLTDMIKYINKLNEECEKEESKIKGSKKGSEKNTNISKSSSDTELSEKILEKIPKTKINFKKQIELEEEILKENNDTNSILYEEEDDSFLEVEEKTEKVIINKDYLEELTEKVLSNKLKDITNPDLMALYTYFIDQTTQKFHALNAFGNKTFLDTLNQETFKSEKNKIINLYLKNFLFIQEQVEYIIQSLIDKIATIPYSVRCICTIIDIILSKKFPLLPKYFRHSYIGKFLFNKCIFPFLSLENRNGLKAEILVSFQVKCLKCIVEVLSRANECKLFDIFKDREKTMFNYYLLEIIPILNNFYDNLVDMNLPTQLTEFIEKSSHNDNFENNNSLYSNGDTDNKNIENKVNYDYFKENSDEIIRIKSVCFSEMDILFILKLIYKNIDLFKDLQNFDRLRKALKEKDIKNLEETITNERENRKKRKLENVDGKGYYTIFYEEQNYQLKDLNNTKETKGDKSLLFRIKSSIKTILRRLNLLNKKQYSYLNFATSNEKFFQALNCTLKDFEGSENDKGEVPLSWHSKFIVNNKNHLEEKYLLNDFENLYNEMLNEESILLEKLKLLSPIINAREIMNLNCAENAIENMEYDIKNLQRAKKLKKIEIFVSQDTTEVCIRNIIIETKVKTKKHHRGFFEKIKIKKHIKKEKETQKEDTKENINENYIQIYAYANCPHQSEIFFAKTQGKKIQVRWHAKGVYNFINKLRKPNGKDWECLLAYIKEDIETGESKHKIFKLFDDYKSILKNSLINDYQDLIEEENETNEIIDKVKDFIIQKIYKNIFPSIPLAEDKSFYETTKSYDWIPSTFFDVKVELPLEAIKDSISYVIQMEEKAFSISEKIKCFMMIYNNLNKINEFYCDECGKSANEQTPIFNYIILKAHPKRFISNINFINCFTDDKTISGQNARLFITNSLASVQKIWSITPASLNLSVDEFNKRNGEAYQRLSHS